MAEGIIKWFDEQKGYGFIAQDDGEDVYVHRDAIESEGFGTLKAGDRVEFDVVRGRKGLQATNVCKLKPRSKSPWD
jgi:CspA family cold shock protein